MKNTDKTSTGGLMSGLLKTKSIKHFISRNGEQMATEPFNKYLEKLCEEKEMIPSAVVKAANIERTYGLQIFRGIKNPSRDKIIQLAFGFSLNVEETQKLLKSAEKSILYPKIKRDAVIIYCLNNNSSITETQEMLCDLQLPLLGGETA